MDCITEMFVGAIMGKSDGAGYLVRTDSGYECGPYATLKTAEMCAADLGGADVIDMETGELMNWED